METQSIKSKTPALFRVQPTATNSKVNGGVFGKGRILIGRAESCNMIVEADSVSAIHAVLEIFDDKAKIYDMNSTNGTFVNGEKVLVKEIKLNDTFSIANIEFKFIPYQVEPSLPPVLDSLEPSKVSVTNKQPPVAPTVSADQVPKLVYPLSLDPRADSSEYIFEDAHEIYPIFKYEIGKSAVEVIILFEDRVFSIDYLPQTDGVYSISGVLKSANEIEFPYLGKTEKIPFVEVRGGQASVQKLFGYDTLHLSDQTTKSVNQTSGSVDLRPQDILRFSKDKIQIYVRSVEAPPKVAHAPLIKRDPEFRKYLFLLLLLVFLVTGSFPFLKFEEDKEKEDEKAPDRMATILYKQKLTTAITKAVEKTENAPKVVQKAPPKVVVAKEKPQPKPEVTKPDVMNVENNQNKPDPGIKTAPTKQEVRKADVKPINKPLTANSAAKGPSKSLSTNSAAALTKFESKSKGPVDVYKSSDFSTSVNSLLAKGGSLSGVQTKSASGSSTGLGGGVVTGVGSGGDLKRAEIGANTGSLVGTNTGVLGQSKGAEGLSAKKAVFTAGIPSETVVLGSMDPDVIRRILMDHLPQFRHCYQSELERTGADTRGVIKLDFAIGASGHVTNAGAEGSDLPGSVKKCVVGILRGIQFPEPSGGGSVEVKQPLNFYAKNI